MNDMAVGGETPGWQPILLDLHSCNSALWKLEESVRKNGLEDREVAVLKREIDRCNMQRHRAISELDRLFFEQFSVSSSGGSGAVLNSETLGQMLDRLSVLLLKRRNFSAKSDFVSLEKVERHMRHICACFDNAVREIMRGALPPGCDELKDYGDAGS